MRRDLPGPTAFFYPPLRLSINAAVGLAPPTARLQAGLVMRRDGRYAYPSGGVRAPRRWGCTAFLVICHCEAGDRCHWLRNS